MYHMRGIVGNVPHGQGTGHVNISRKESSSETVVCYISGKLKVYLKI